MIRVLVLASASVGILAQTSITGLPSCQCLGKLPSTVDEVDCTYGWAINGKCYKTVGLVSNFTIYPGDYGETCKAHKEPGHGACFDLVKVPPEEKAMSDQAGWCNQKWCYIDPCNCDAADATKSDYFPGELFYSYGTCGDKNTYTASESATNTVGNAECASVEKASDAYSLKMGLGLVLAGLGALA